MLIGYYNRNQKADVEIPVGPENQIEPGGPDYGQPTRFLPGRQFGMFTIRVPADFGEKKLTWTITTAGKTTKVPVHLNLLWEVAPFKDADNNTPPYLSFREGGPFKNGPAAETQILSGTVGQPVNLPVWVADDEKMTAGAKRPSTPPARISWSKFRGPGDVAFSEARLKVEPGDIKAAPADTIFKGKATVTATVKEPGDYVLRVQANDWTGEGGAGFQCCWSSAFVKLTVTPAKK